MVRSTRSSSASCTGLGRTKRRAALEIRWRARRRNRPTTARNRLRGIASSRRVPPSSDRVREPSRKPRRSGCGAPVPRPYRRWRSAPRGTRVPSKAPGAAAEALPRTRSPGPSSGATNLRRQPLRGRSGARPFARRNRQFHFEARVRAGLLDQPHFAAVTGNDAAGDAQNRGGLFQLAHFRAAPRRKFPPATVCPARWCGWR